MNGSLQTEFAGITFKNPVVLASGTCGFGREYNDIFDIERLGGISSKGLTLNPRRGNEGKKREEKEREDEKEGKGGGGGVPLEVVECHRQS
jgi:dihydroorotate dehydrogenase